MHFKVVCINSSDRPEVIPSSRWIEKGKEYTVILVAKLNMQGGALGFKLAEVNIDEFFPYQFFAAKRFALPVTGQQWAEELLSRTLEEAKKEFQEQPLSI